MNPVARSPHQAPLALRLRVHQTLDSFLEDNAANTLACAALRRLLRAESLVQPPDRMLHLWGAGGSGKSHLVNAAARAAQGDGRRVAVIDFGGLEPVRAEWFESLHHFGLVAIEGLDLIARQAAWEQGLFRFLDRSLVEGTTRILLTSRRPPACLDIGMPDLASRLGWGLALPLQKLDDTGILRVLRERAAALGLRVDEAAIRYLLARQRRDLAGLLALLDDLDRASLAAQRRVTLPFVQAFLAGRGGAAPAGSATQPR